MGVTVTGAVASFDTEYKPSRINSVVAGITPVQDLHGYDFPWPAGGGINKFSGQWHPDVIGVYAGFEMPATSYCRLAIYDKNNGADISGAYIGLSENGIETPVTWVVSNGQPYGPTYNPTNGCYTVGYAERKYVSIYPPTQETLTKLLNRYNILCFVDDTSETWEFSPYSNICPISGWTGVAGQRTGKNLLDTTLWVEGKYIGANGSIGSESGNHYSENFSPIKAGTYTLSIRRSPSRRVLVRLHGYNSQQEWVQQVYSINLNQGDSTYSEQITIGTGIDYLRISITDSASNIQLELGSTATAYAPYTGEQISVEFPALGKNLFNPVDLISGGFFGRIGDGINQNTNYSRTYIFVHGLSKITLSGLKGGMSSGCGVQFFDANKSWVSTDDYGQQNEKSYPVPSNAYYAGVSVFSGNNASYNDVDTFQVEAGETATTYEPYTNTVYGGTVDPTTGVLTVDKQHVVVNGDTKLNKGGSVYYGDYGTNTYVNIPSVGFSAAEIMYKPCYADKAQKTNAITWVYPDSNIWKYAINAYTQLHIVFENTVVGITSGMTADERLEAIKTWLTSNPMHFVLPLATPKTYQLTPQQAFSILAGQNNIWFDTGDTTVDWEQLVLQGVDVMMRRRNILAGLPHIEEESGAVASFNTNMALQLKKCQFAIEPVQSGTGDQSPSNVRPISGWTGVAGQRTGKNLFAGYGKHTYIKPNTAYFLSSGSLTGGKRIRFQAYDNDGTLITSPTVANSPNYYASGNVIVRAGDTAQLSDALTITNTTAAYIVAIDDSGAPFYYPNFPNIQLEVGNTATAYAPYTGEQITVEFPALGKNLLDARNTTHSAYNIGMIPNTLQPNTQYTFSINGITTSKYKLYMGNLSDSNTAVTVLHDGGYIGAGQSVTFTTPTEMLDGLVLAGNSNGAGNVDLADILPQIQLGNQATSYEPYTNTVYGGTVDVVTGVLTVDKAKIVLNGTETWTSSGGLYTSVSTLAKLQDYSNAICADKLATSIYQTSMSANSITGYKDTSGRYPNSNWIYAKVNGVTTVADISAWLAQNPLEVVYQLATPKTYQLTPQQITALKGQNNVWCDTGNTTVKYWKH